MTEQFRMKFPRRPATMPAAPDPVFPEPLEDDDDDIVESDTILVLDDHKNELLVSESKQLIYSINGVVLPEPIENEDDFVVLDPEPVSPDAPDATASLGERDDVVIPEPAPAQADDAFPPPHNGFTLVPEEDDDAPIITEPLAPPPRPPKTYISPNFNMRDFRNHRRSTFSPPPCVAKPAPPLRRRQAVHRRRSGRSGTRGDSR
jgi:hypothetical protein